MAPRTGQFERDYPASDTFAEAIPLTTVFQASCDSQPPTLTLRTRGNPTVEIHNTSGRPPDEITFKAITADLITLGIAPDR